MGRRDTRCRAGLASSPLCRFEANAEPDGRKRAPPNDQL